MRKGRLAFKYFIIGIGLVIIYLIVRPGIYYGIVNIDYSLQTDNIFSSLRIRAETKPRWYWIEPRNHIYGDITLNIDSGKIIKGNLRAGTWDKDSDSGKLDIPGLARMIAPKEPLTAEYRSQLQGILENLDALHKGTFYPPRHHTYYFDKPVKMSCSQGTDGTNYSFIGLLAWIGIWPVCMFVSKRPQKVLLHSPIKAFFITFFIVVTVNLLLILIWKVFSPGPISEILEFVIVVLNFPASLLFTNGLGPWAGIGLSALLWGDIVSGIIWDKAETKNSQIVEPENK
jgi:hypothetical protein